MKINFAYFTFLLYFLMSVKSLSQEVQSPYIQYIEQANKAYDNKEYKIAGSFYHRAFLLQKGSLSDRYDAVCTWSLAGDTAKAISTLSNMAKVDSFSMLHYLQTDMDLEALRQHKDWPAVYKQVSENRFFKQPNLDRELVEQLDTINYNDQYLRKYAEVLEAKFGANAEEVKTIWKQIELKDAENLIKVKTILTQKSWPSIAEIGAEGSSRIFLVIQHAPLKDQIELLPIVQAAHNSGNLESKYFVMLEDRIAVRQGKHQTYGTQLGYDKNNNNSLYLLPVADLDNLDKRRTAIGLLSIASYFKSFNAEWDIESYKKNLPRYIEALKKQAEK